MVDFHDHMSFLLILDFLSRPILLPLTKQTKPGNSMIRREENNNNSLGVFGGDKKQAV